MKIPFISLLLLAAASSWLRGQDAEDFNPIGRDLPTEQMQLQLRIQVEWIELSHEDLTTLLEEDEGMRRSERLSGNAGPLRDSIKSLIDKNDARILETAIVIARSGQRAKVESITEFIYPTEYDPPTAIVSSNSKEQSVSIAPQATAFETRNLGVTLEVDPVIGADDQTIDLNLAPEIVYLVDQENYGSFESDDSTVEVVMPTFYTMRTTTQIALMDGEYAFIGAHSPFNEKTMRTDPEHKVMLFVKADIVYVGLSLPEEVEEE